MNKVNALLASCRKAPRFAVAAAIAAVVWGATLTAQAQDLIVRAHPIGQPGIALGTPLDLSVPASSNVTVSASQLAVSANYQFAYWVLETNCTLRAGTTNDPTVFLSCVTNNLSLLTAYFFDVRPKLTIQINPPGAGFTVPAAGTYTQNLADVVSVLANANSTYSFVGWTGAAVSPANPVSVSMNGSDKTLVANFGKSWTISQFFYNGYAVPGPFKTNAPDGANVTVTVPVPVGPGPGGSRYRCNGYSGGVNINPTAIVQPHQFSASITPITADVQLTWQWVNQFPISVIPPTNGTAIIIESSTPGDGDPNDSWVDANTTIIINLQPTDPAAFQPDYCLVGTNKLYPDINGDVYPAPVVSAITVRPYFKAISAPLLPAWFTTMWGLQAGTAGSGPADDPDRDGLNNSQEAMLSATNKGLYFNPLNADTDGDGMDDGYETGSIDPAQSNQQAGVVVNFTPAALDNGNAVVDKGPAGNPDGDYHWSTTDGYQRKDQPLVNMEEYKGPDGLLPSYITLNNGDAGYPMPNNPNHPAVTVMVTNVFETGDQSKANAVDTDKDTMDDGFEYSWDRWQQAYSVSNEVFLLGVTNGVAVYYTNTVRRWDGVTNATRVFNPKTVYVNDGGPDMDILYDYGTAKVSQHYFDAVREYSVWKPNALSVGVAGAPNSIVMTDPPNADPNPQRSSNPFLWDVDQDGLPDGYEVVFGYDPWAARTPGHVRMDGDDNPDDDWMANLGTNNLALHNHEVYVATNFDPRTAWAQVYPDPGHMPGPGVAPAPNTKRYSNIDELRGPNGLIMTIPSGPLADDATHPFSPDSDNDGIWDGWENYIGLNASDPLDAGLDADGDTLSNFAEFQSFVTSSTNRQALVPVQGWMNKIFPTDISNGDTDGDQVKDATEKSTFSGGGAVVTNDVLMTAPDGSITETQIVFTAGTWNGHAYTGGGLNPTCSDTDGDTMPDPFEACYPGGSGLDGTLGDTFNDPDHDKLPNYLEYYSASVYHWQYDVWTPGKPSYDSTDFYGGPNGTPKLWDWSQLIYNPLAAGAAIGRWGYVCANPNLVDSDSDGMDDYYEIYHGLNPTYGVWDLVLSRDFNGAFPIGVFSPLIGDPRTEPYVNGSPFMDSDGDGLPNSEEGVNLIDPVSSPQYHTCPSPLWLKDKGFNESYVNLYYSVNPFGFWPWSGILPPPTYAYDFESVEGFDTDGDAFSDRQELQATQTDPLSPEHPIKRRALYLPPGLSSYARTCYPYTYLQGEVFRSFTVEAWVRPINPASGQEQIVVERPMNVPIGNPMYLSAGIRVNFRLGVDPAGLPYVAYHGQGQEAVFYQAKAPAAARLPSNDWTHLCGTYQVPSNTDPNQRGALILYVNGQMAAQTNPDELPAISRFGNGNTAPYFYLGGPIMVGAADLNPDGDMDATTIIPTSPVPANFFKGWIDEVRIWDGARSQSEVVSAMTKRMKQADVLSGGGNAVPMYLYSFDALPDPKHSPTAPAGLGFDVTGNSIFPATWTGVGFWATELSRSQVYAGSSGGDPRFVPWIWNTVAHLPVVPPVDIGDPAAVITVMNGTNIVSQTVPFANTTNPYRDTYTTAPAKPFEIFTSFDDLLPSGYAAADEDIPMWDGGGIPSSQPFSSAGDGIPDAWREAHGMDPLNPTGISAPTADPDSDGLNNFYEYLSGTDPKSVISTASGIPDGDLDADGDGLSNIQEQNLGTMPNMKDTDDDGLTDWEEANGAVDPTWVRPATSPLPVNSTDPLNPLSPAIPRSVYLNGNARLKVPPSDKLMNRDWTVETWVKPEAVTNITGGVLVSRFVQGLTSADYAINYEVGLETNNTVAPSVVVSTNAGVVTTNVVGTLRPYVRYLVSTNGTPKETRVDGLAATEHFTGLQQVTIPIGAWTHVAGLYNSASNVLALYVNGKLASYRTDGANLPPLVYGYVSSHRDDEVTIGASRSTGPVTNGYRGWLDEVRIWAGARSDTDIFNNYNGPLQSGAGQTTAGKAYTELAPSEQSQADTLLAKAQSLAAAGGNKYTVKYSPVLLRPMSHLCGLKNNPGDFPPPDLAHIAPASAVPVGLPATFSWLAKNDVTPIKDQGQCGSCWAFATVGAFECALKIATGQDYDLSEQYLVSCNKDGWSCNGGLTAHKYHFDTPAADGKFGAVYESDDPYKADDTLACGGPYNRPFVLKDWAFIGTGDDDLSIPDAKIKQAIFDHGPVQCAIYVGPAFQAYAGGIFNTSEPSPTGYGNHSILLVGWNDTEGYWILRNQWGTGWGENGYMRIAYGTSGVGQGASYVDYSAATAFSGKLAEFRFDDGGITAQDFQVPKDWLNNWSSAAVLDGARFETNSVNVAPLDKDTDGDGLPDWWEMAYGLNPYDATGDNGGNGDPDGDGLCNAAEYKAGTDPLRFDTRKSGASDFYAWDSIQTNELYRYRIYGELYTDHDGMDDWWEQMHGLDPRLYDAQLDPDQDGWSNVSEFQDATDPQDSTSYPVPSVTFNMKYVGLNGPGNLIINAYSSASMDGPPDATYDLAGLPFVQVTAEQLLPGLAGALAFGNVVPGSLTITVTGVGAGMFIDNGSGILVGTVAGTAGTIDYVTGGYTLVMPIPPVTLTATYRYRSGAATYPMSLTFAKAKTGYLKEGNAWFFAFIDRNGNRSWDPGEPAGVAQYQPIDVRRGAFTVTIGLTDMLPGYQRFAWTAQPGQTVYPVQITDQSRSGLLLASFSIRAPRTWLDEQDYRLAGLFGLPFTSLGITVLGSDGVTTIATNFFDTAYYSASPATPTCVTPAGAPLHYAMNEFVWNMDTNATRFELVIKSGSTAGATVLDVTDVPTFREADGTTHYRLPIYAGDGAFTNGVYYWQVKSLNPRANSAFSAWSAFSVDLTDQPQGPWSIQGNVVYPGKVTNANWIVQAYLSAGFGGAPAAQVTVKNVVTTNAWPLNRMHYALQGLPRGTYYVRAFLDQNGNGTKDVWETAGFLSSSSIYQPTSVDLPASASSKDVYVMFADTDNDKLADDWEYQYYGNLTAAGPGPLRGYTVSASSTNINVYECYAKAPLNMSPINPNVAGADGLPLRLKDALGLDVWSVNIFRISDMRTDAAGRAQVSWPALSSAGVMALGTGSAASIAGTGMTLHYQLQFTDDLVTWQDVPAQGSVSYDAVTRLLRFTDVPAGPMRHYYRYRVWWE